MPSTFSYHVPWWKKINMESFRWDGMEKWLKGFQMLEIVHTSCLSMLSICKVPFGEKFPPDFPQNAKSSREDSAKMQQQEHLWTVSNKEILCPCNTWCKHILFSSLKWRIIKAMGMSMLMSSFCLSFSECNLFFEVNRASQDFVFSHQILHAFVREQAWGDF